MKRKSIEVKSTLKKYGKNFKELLFATITPPMAGRFTGYMIVGVATTVVGVVIMPLTRSIYFGLFPVFIGLSLIILGLLYKRNVLRGYTIVEGSIIEHTKIFPGVNAADGYVIQTKEQGRIHIPNTKRKSILPLGTMLRVYISVASTNYTRNGITSYGNVLGFEVIWDDPSSRE